MSVLTSIPKRDLSPKAGAAARGNAKTPLAGGLHKPSMPGALPPPGAPWSVRPPDAAFNKPPNPPRAASTQRIGSTTGPNIPGSVWNKRSKSSTSAPGAAVPTVQRQSWATVGTSVVVGTSTLTRSAPPAVRATVPQAGKKPISSIPKGDSIQPRASWYWRAASIGLIGIPYLFDYYRSHQAQVYENTHAGYHSVERHDAWYRPANMLRRTQKHPKKKKLSQMINWAGGHVPHYKISSQFATDNWQLYSIGQGEDHLRKLDKKAVIDQNQAKGWVKGHDFTIKYTGWTTGWSYDAKHKDGEACEYIYYAYSKDPANPTHYFLGQHFPKTTPAKNNFTVSTWRLI